MRGLYDMIVDYCCIGPGYEWRCSGERLCAALWMLLVKLLFVYLCLVARAPSHCAIPDWESIGQSRASPCSCRIKPSSHYSTDGSMETTLSNEPFIPLSTEAGVLLFDT